MPFANINEGSLRLRICRKCLEQFNYRGIPSTLLPFHLIQHIKWTGEWVKARICLQDTLCSKASESLAENKQSCWRCFSQHSLPGDPRYTSSAPRYPSPFPACLLPLPAALPRCQQRHAEPSAAPAATGALDLPFHRVQCNKILWAQHSPLGACYCIPS